MSETDGEIHRASLQAEPQAGARYLETHGERVAWIMGSSRSGSTWLLRMLSELDRVGVIDDPHIGHHLSVWRPLPLAWASGADRPALTTLADVKRAKPDYFFSDAYRDAWMPVLGELIRTRFGAQLSDQVDLEEDPYLVVKEPSSHPAEILLEAMPGSRLIFLLRDGRDVVDSWLDAYQDGSWAMEEGAFAADDDKRLPLVEWLSSVWAFRTRELMRVFGRLSPDRRTLVRYENLLRDPVRELERICTMIGIEACAEELRGVCGRHEFSRVESGERGPLQEIRSATPGGWRENLSAEEQKAMHEIMSDQLRAFGYLPAGEVVAA